MNWKNILMLIGLGAFNASFIWLGLSLVPPPANIPIESLSNLGAPIPIQGFLYLIMIVGLMAFMVAIAMGVQNFDGEIQ